MRAFLLTLAVTALSSVSNAGLLPNIQSILSFGNKLSSHEPQITSSRDSPAPLHVPVHADKLFPNRYLVLFHDQVTINNLDDIKAHFLKLHAELWLSSHGERTIPDFFSIHSLHGFVADLTPDLLNFVREQPAVLLVERDATFSVDNFDTQKDATWGLDRISHRKTRTTESPHYLYDNDAGLGVNAYVIDTGIKVEHQQFEGRAKWGSAIALPRLPFDGHGHGTHCAGTIGSRDYGVAKKVNLIAVGVMTPLGTGSTSDIIKGLDFVASDHRSNVAARKKGFKGLVVNMSIGGGALEALDLAVNAAVKAGLHVAVAAGNDNNDACLSSPGRADGPITVGATGADDSIAPFSNWGKCVNVFAPGVDIKSTFTWSETTEMSGTSMASPHIAGLLAYFLSLAPDPALEFGLATAIDPSSLKRMLLAYATKNVVRNLNSNGSPNLLGFNGAGHNISEKFLSS